MQFAKYAIKRDTNIGLLYKT